jgi:hypothetical protein
LSCDRECSPQPDRFLPPRILHPIELRTIYMTASFLVPGISGFLVTDNRFHP